MRCELMVGDAAAAWACHFAHAQRFPCLLLSTCLVSLSLSPSRPFPLSFPLSFPPLSPSLSLSICCCHCLCCCFARSPCRLSSLSLLMSAGCGRRLASRRACCRAPKAVGGRRQPGRLLDIVVQGQRAGELHGQGRPAALHEPWQRQLGCQQHCGRQNASLRLVGMPCSSVALLA